MEETTKIIEINGVKFEVDARTATLRQIDKVSVGARVKVMKKTYSGYEVHHGVVVGFEPFRELPTVIVAYISTSYTSNAPEIQFLYFNAKSEDVQIIIADEDDKAALQACNIVGKIDKEIAKKHAEIQDLEDRKKYFENNFRSYWSEVVPKVAA